MSKLPISPKEANKTNYWIELLAATDYIENNMRDSLTTELNEIIAILKTAKKANNEKLKTKNMKTNNLIQNAIRTMKSVSLFTLLFSFLFVSCSKSEIALPQDNEETTTFTLAVEGVQTRATTVVTPARYVMEVWSEDGLTAENVFGTGDAVTNHVEITSGSITITLDKTKAYTCLFWADFDANNTTGSFDATSLKAISLNADKEMTEAYFANVAVVEGKNPAVTVTLKRAVARITLTETATVKTTDNLELKLSSIYPTFSVLDGEASGIAAEWTTMINPSATTGTIATFYFFAKAETVLSELKFTYPDEPQKTVSNIPVQQNHATSIKGEYSSVFSGTFSITNNDVWLSSDDEVYFDEKTAYKLGDIYPNATAPIGVVFWIDNADHTYNSTEKTSAKGKIVSLDEGTSKKWDTAQKWTSTTILPNGMTWSIPSKDELKDEIYLNRETLNNSLGNIGGAVQFYNMNSYWSSTQSDADNAWFVSFNAGAAFTNTKSSIYSVRLVLAF